MTVKHIEKFIEANKRSIMFTMKAIARKSEATKYDDQVGCLIVNIKDKNQIAFGYNTCDYYDSMEIVESIVDVPVNTELLVYNMYKDLANKIIPGKSIKHAEVSALECWENNVDKDSWEYNKEDVLVLVSKKPCRNCFRYLEKEVGAIVYPIDDKSLVATRIDSIADSSYLHTDSMDIPDFTLHIPTIEYIYKL